MTALPPSPSVSSIRCHSPVSPSDPSCFFPPLPPDPCIRPPLGGLSLEPGASPVTGESSFDEPTWPLEFQSVSRQPKNRPSVIRSVSSTSSDPAVSFEEFAGQYRRCEHVRNQKKDLEHRLIATRIAIGLSARLLRIDVSAQKGLLESFKYSDKSGFITIFNAVRDIQDACESALHRNIHRPVPVAESPLVQHSDKIRSSGFMNQLTTQARNDLLHILALVRTDSEFLFERIRSLSPSQLAALSSPAASLDVGDAVLSFNSRSRSQQQSLKRNSTHSTVFKDHVLALERNDPLAVLLFNVFAVPLDWDSAEARLRLDVWSSTCSKLLAVEDSKYYTFLGHVLSHWTQCSDWTARPKLELYLMDVLQQGAFLLENIESPMIRSFGGVEAPDPLRTDVAEEFFETAIKNLFEVLDDADAGLPSAALEFTNAILAKLTSPESKNGLIEYVLMHWFFAKFLYNTMCFPEVRPFPILTHLYGKFV